MKVLTVPEVADRLRCSTDSVYRRKAELGAFRNGRSLGFTEEGLEQFMEANRVKAPGPAVKAFNWNASDFGRMARVKALRMARVRAFRERLGGIR